jgi:hypothetical protein
VNLGNVEAGSDSYDDDDDDNDDNYDEIIMLLMMATLTNDINGNGDKYKNTYYKQQDIG